MQALCLKAKSLMQPGDCRLDRFRWRIEFPLVDTLSLAGNFPNKLTPPKHVRVILRQIVDPPAIGNRCQQFFQNRHTIDTRCKNSPRSLRRVRRNTSQSRRNNHSLGSCNPAMHTSSDCSVVLHRTDRPSCIRTGSSPSILQRCAYCSRSRFRGTTGNPGLAV